MASNPLGDGGLPKPDVACARPDRCYALVRTKNKRLARDPSMIKLIRRASAEARAFMRRETEDDEAGVEATSVDVDEGGDAVPSKRNARRRPASGKPKAEPQARPQAQSGRGRKRRVDKESDTATDLAPPGRKPRFAPVTFSEEDGVRFLHFGTEWVQGAMRLRHPWRIELEYAQQMMAWLLFLDAPARIAQLGLGAAALTKFCYKHMPRSRVEVAELNPAVVVAARSMFALPPDDARLCVTECDAWDYVNDTAQHRALGVLQVDLYDATARGPVLDSVAFYRACRLCLTAPGMMTVNLFGDHPSFEKNFKHLSSAFDGRVIALPEVHEGNRIVLAFNGPALAFDAEQLAQRARQIEKIYGLPARGWLDKLTEATGRPDFAV